MNPIVKQFVDYIISDESPKGNKEDVISAAVEKFNLCQDRKIYSCRFFAVRFSYTKDAKSFSNTVLSLSALQKYDRVPVFVVRVIANDNNIVYLANSTFISKISHSSHQLTMTNIKGSFNGSDIMKQYHGIANDAAHYEELFMYHHGLEWQDNLMRLVEETGKIVGTGSKFSPDENQKANIFNSVNRAINFYKSDYFGILRSDLEERVKFQKENIFCASRIENVNLRGRMIEYLISNAYNEGLAEALRTVEDDEPTILTHNDLGDYHQTFGTVGNSDNFESYTDIKTKVIYLNSNPKAYNIDKFLSCMAESNTVFLFFFVGIDNKGIESTQLCPVFDKTLINATVCQFHWAGRNSRGVTQLKGEDINTILDSQFKVSIDTDIATKFLQELLDR